MKEKLLRKSFLLSKKTSFFFLIQWFANDNLTTTPNEVGREIEKRWEEYFKSKEAQWKLLFTCDEEEINYLSLYLINYD